MPTLYPLASTTALANLRTDLSDTDSSSYRWTDASLNRAIDRAVERLSWAAPWIQSQQIPTIAGSAIYGAPAGAWYIDRVEYPAGSFPKSFPPFLERKSPYIAAPVDPLGLMSASFGSGGNLSSGQYSYAITFVVPGGGETTPGAYLTFLSTGFNGGVATLQNIPIGPHGVCARNIYRSDHTGNPNALLLAGIIPDNISTTYIDAAGDGNRSGPPPAANTTQNLDQFELQIPPELYPNDTTTTFIEVSYATKHQLDTSGTTIPERHWDALYYGAVAHAMQSYLPQVNDNFEYADGQLRDRVDDTKSTIAWQTQCAMAKADFEAKLHYIKEESNVGVAATTHWGDVPIRWERL